MRVCVTFLWIISLLGIGCGPSNVVVPERRPRPVIVDTLRKRPPPAAAFVSASVGSWKTEQIGFEVGGRVEFVVEPNTEIEGKVLDKDGNPIIEGTPIARLENERYALAVARAKADVTRATQNLRVAETELSESIPAQIAAAVASQTLAETEFERSRALFAQKAGAQGDIDRDQANYQNAISQVKQLEATQKSQEAQVESLRNAILQAGQNLRDAERNLEDCTLYSSFRGQIADVAVVPGSVVAAGQPVATIQMMNPIKLELEVSARDSRRLERTERLPVHFTMPDGTVKTEKGFLYRVDPVADARTRTFTVTLLVMNQKLTTTEIESAVARTKDVWRLDFEFLPGAQDGMLFIEEEALLHDSDGFYVWQVTNVTIDTRRTTNDSHVYKVRKLRVKPEEMKIPFLGNWVFQQISTDDAEFDPKRNLVVGKLLVADGEPSDWSGDTVLVDAGGQWMLRPGDLVKVDISSAGTNAGYYVPMSAIAREMNQSFLFALDVVEGKPIAKRLPIRLDTAAPQTTTSSLCRIEPLEATPLDGLQYVTEGAHYLVDGEEVNPVPLSEAVR